MRVLSGVCWLFIGLISIASVSAKGQEVREEIRFPDLPGYLTLACDLHMHTTFSDGSVLPPIRVNEGWREGFDLIAITDHIAYHPKRNGTNRSFELASDPASAHNLLLARGAEITYRLPTGHFNAIFTTDNDALNVQGFQEVIKKANEQGAFVFWNHPGNCKWQDDHNQIYENKWLHGAEICNGNTYYPDVHRWCLDKNLTLIGNSDIHEPDLRAKSDPKDHRTMTLVFAKERTLPAIKEALLQGRTVVWFKEQLIGKKEFLEPLFKKGVVLGPEPVWKGKAVHLQFQNLCQTEIQLKNTGSIGPAEIKIPARSTSLVTVKVDPKTESLNLQYTVANFLIEPETTLPVSFEIVKKAESQSAEQKSTDEKSAEEKSTEEKSTEQKSTEQKSTEEKSTEQKSTVEN